MQTINGISSLRMYSHINVQILINNQKISQFLKRKKKVFLNSILMRKFKMEFRNLSSSYATTIQDNFDDIYSLIDFCHL